MMPSVFLSPSTQSYNLYITGGNEKEHMNRLADAMQPFLDLACIAYGRNDPEGDVRKSVAMSNEGDYDIHLALHSNAAPPELSGQLRGPLVMHYPGSVNGERAAEYAARALAEIYPEPGKVLLRPEAGLYELAQTQAPCVFVEVAYHDNREDAEWIVNNTVAIADRLTQALAEYFGLPYAIDDTPFTAVVCVPEVNLRRLPGTEYPRVAALKNGEAVTVLRRIPCWSYVRTADGTEGFAVSRCFSRV